MRASSSVFATLALLACGMACDGSIPPQGADADGGLADGARLGTTPPTNNQTDLFGATLGTGSGIGLRKPITVTLPAGEKVFVAGPSYALRPSLTSRDLYTIVPLTNTSPDLKCFVKTAAVNLLDASNNVLVTSSMLYVTGSVGELTSATGPLLTDTCVGPGELGYFLDIVDNPSSKDLFTPTVALVFMPLAMIMSPGF